jgi:hypothetical protein
MFSPGKQYLLLNPEDFVACLARGERVWKGGIPPVGVFACVRDFVVKILFDKV